MTVLLGFGNRGRSARAFAQTVLDARHGAEDQAQLDHHPQHDDDDRQRKGHFDDRRTILVAAKPLENAHHSVLIPATAWI